MNIRKYIFSVERYKEIRTVFVSTTKIKLFAINAFCFLDDMSCVQLYQVDSGLDHVIRSCLFKTDAL